MSRIVKSILLISLAASLASCCYRMPEEEEYSLIPSTNNPTFTREKAGKTPGIGY